ncbi:MAG: T9SS type A sorting domain-containing protein [Candidatus Cloacimonadales bacterium]
MSLVKLSKLLILLLLMGVNQLFSLTEIATNQTIAMESKDYSLYNFQNESAITYWYGAETWAVRFIATEFVVNATSLTVNSVNIYFPTIPQTPVTVRGFTYTEGSHFDPLFGEQIPELNLSNISITEAGWHRFNLSSSYSGEGLWVIVDNETHFQNKYMASATGSGKSSFYKVVENNTAYFRRFYDLNITQELLFTLDGYVESEGVIDEFKILKTTVEYSRDDLWEYNYLIRNYLPQPATNLELLIEVEHPNPEVYSSQTFTHLINLEPLSDNTINSESPIFLQLPVPNSQYKITTTLRRDSLSSESYSNTLRVTNFAEEDNTAIIMNFVSGNNFITEQVLASQHNVTQANWYIFNLGIDGSDQLFYSNYAYQYFVNFGVNLTPLTIINGTTYFNSFNVSAMEQNLENNIYYFPKVFDLIEETITDNENSTLTYHTSFNYGERYLFDSFAEHLDVDVFISQQTKHFSEVGDEFVVTEIPGVTANFERLNDDGDAFFEFTYEADSVDSLYTTSNGNKFANAIIYRTDTNEIISFRRFQLQDNILVSNEEHEVQEARTLSTYPNPCYSGETLHLRSNSKENYATITLYNIRGQKVGTFHSSDNSYKLPSQLATGVYFMKATTPTGNSSQLRKILILRRIN